MANFHLLHASNSAFGEKVFGRGAEAVKRCLRRLKIVGKKLLRLARDMTFSDSRVLTIAYANEMAFGLDGF